MKWTCKFCNFASCKQKAIVNHYKDKHGRGITGFSCIYPNCFTVFQSHVELVQHLKCHKQGTSPIAKLRCELCSFSAPSNIKHYFLHLKRHLMNRVTVNCPFVGCSFKSRVASTFTAHRSRHHQASTFNHFKPELILHCPSQDSVNDEEDNFDLESPDVSVTEPDSQPTQKSVERRIASLFLRLQAVLHVSKSAIQELVDDLFDIGERAGQITRESIENVLKEHNYSSEECLTSLTEAFQSANPLNLLSREGSLGTDYKRQSYYKKNFSVIEHVEYLLNRQEKSHTVVYIPILKLLSNLLKREEVLQALAKTNQLNSLATTSLFWMVTSINRMEFSQVKN